MTELSVLLATHNGADLLQRTLDGYVALGDPGFDWEIIIVDNASTDNTRAVLDTYKDKLPLITAYEAEAGKNRALNTGIPLITSEHVILTDNDAIPRQGFLNDWLNAFKQNPNVDIFGGAITPIFDSPMPDWMLKHKPRFAELYSLREGIPDGPIGADYIFGPNMAARRSVFERGVLFDANVGPNSETVNYAMGSETAFCRMAEAQGMTLSYASKPCVSHIVRANQTTQDFRNQRAYRLGLGTARKHEIEGKIKPVSKNPVIACLKAIARPIVRLTCETYMRLKTYKLDPLAKSESVWNLYFFRGYQAGRKIARKDTSIIKSCRDHRVGSSCSTD